jgi:hypothetical protein
MRKVYKKLSAEQIKRGVIFSSCLSKYTTEQENDTIHEVLNTDKEKDLIIERLKDDKFFNQSHFKYNIIRRL